MHLRRSLVTVAFPLLVTTTSRPSLAEPVADAKHRANVSFTAGRVAFARGDFAAAGAAFEQAALHAPHPGTDLNAAEAWELAGNPVRAAILCDRVLATPSLEKRYRDVAAAQLTRVEPKIALLVVDDGSFVRAAVDDEEPQPVPRRIRLATGVHVVKVVDVRELTSQRTITLLAGETRRLALEKRPADPAAVLMPTDPTPAAGERPASAESRRSGPPVATWVAFAGAAAALGAAAFFGLRTVNARDAFYAAPTEATRDGFYRERMATNASVTVAGVAALAGVVLWLVAPAPASGGR